MIMNKTILGSMGTGMVSLVYLWEAARLPTGAMAAPDIGYVPWLVGCISLGLSIVLAFTAWRAERLSKPVDTEPIGDGVGPGPWIIASGLLLYPLLLNSLGFIAGTTVLIYVSLLIMGYKRRWAALALALIMSGIAHYLFSEWLGVQFPTGWFGR